MHHEKNINNINKLKKGSTFIDIFLANWPISWTKIHLKVASYIFPGSCLNYNCFHNGHHYI